jgi:hypothetical protein
MDAHWLEGNTGDEYLLYQVTLDTFNRKDKYSNGTGDSILSKDYCTFLVTYDSATYKPKKIYPLLNYNFAFSQADPDVLKRYNFSSVHQDKDSNIWVTFQAKQNLSMSNESICAKDTLVSRGGHDIYIVNITKRPKKIITSIQDDKKSVSSQDVDGSSILSYNVYPNPTIQNINLQYILKDNAEVEIGLYSMRGHKLSVLKEKTKMTSGAYLEQFNLDKDLASGMYLVKIKAGKETLSKQIIKN